MTTDDDRRVSTGFSGLDEIVDDLRIGDNVVWKVDAVDDYRYFVHPFVDRALAAGRTVVYFRFGQHPPLLTARPGVDIIELDARDGFEPFACTVHQVATTRGVGVFYVFDCLSELLSAWATDHMIANFFHVTCPYLFRLDTVAYFALLRNRHALKTIVRIRETTQVLLDLHNRDNRRIVHPHKVWERHSPTMFLPHREEGERFIPMANSLDATALLANLHRQEQAAGRRRLDHWHLLFLQAEQLNTPATPDEEKSQMVRHLCRHMIGCEETILDLARRYFSLDDLLAFKARMLGTGFIGGKAVGMLLARKILVTQPDGNWDQLLEPHDSFFVGSNVYYSYIVHNGWWELYAAQKTADGYFSAGAELHDKMLTGSFPDPLRDDFQSMLDYYGQYPIIVRSSSLLEDSFGNAFAGKYDSFFCANQGTPADRLHAFEDAVRRIFASTMSEEALTYRKQRGLDRQVEQMGLLVQRVSGSYHRHYYFPELAGVGISYNTFVWDKQMDPKAGMLRLVLGLGTRAVDRVEGDYPRIVALDDPLKHPFKGDEDLRRFSQKDLDLININDNELQSQSLFRLIGEGLDLNMERYGVRDRETMERLRQRGQSRQDVWLLTFEPLLTQTDFPRTMQRLLKTLEDVYHYPVDIEFTLNTSSAGEPKINLLQCRPLQTKGLKKRISLPEKVAPEKIFFSAEGGFMGGNTALQIQRLIWIDARHYLQLSLSDKHEVARLIGRLNRRIPDREQQPTLLLGPGRWGTSTPALGVPVKFSEINNMAAIGEIAFPEGDLMPELSFGSHFFQDLVEADIFYLALFPETFPCSLHSDWIYRRSNLLEGLMPSSSRFKPVVKVLDVTDDKLLMLADVVAQRLVCFRDE
ncbi:MAG: PEP/pyruvate-binding domain-containing protein [Desulfuromonadales bacterium]|nr:PEP/pyruvate-binding domain-containing protein [Desulfuromonadales bacterium]